MIYIHQRGRWFHFRRRIPELYSHLYEKGFIQCSLRTDSRQVAEQRASSLNQKLEQIWQHHGLNNISNSEKEFEEAVRITRMGGFDHRPTQEIAREDLGKIISRIESIEDIENPIVVKALLGSHDMPSLILSRVLDNFFDFEKANHLNKNDDQIRKWKNPRIKAVRNFIFVCGDMNVMDITRNDIIKFRQWWHERIKNEGLSTASPNKDFAFISQVLSYVRDDKNLDIDVSALLSRIRFTEIDSTRPPFKANYIKNTLLDPMKLQGLNNECRLFLFAMADTGARPSELVGLNADDGDINLSAEIPYIYIRPSAKRQLKTAHSKRQIPLVGASLYAFQQLPGGFSHYYRKADLLSATINKFLKVHDLLPTKEHCLYSLRHSFEDRLTAVEPPEKLQAALMGHKYSRERYGDGPSLEQKKKWMEKICFEVSN